MTADRDIYLSDARYVAALRRIRNLIAGGEPLHYFDDTTPGNKNTECTWGLCSGSAAAWPDAEDHLWPKKQFCVKYKKPHHRCPLDRRAVADPDPNGCFYTCRVFRAGRSPVPSREETVALYNARLTEVEHDYQKN